MSQAPTMEEYKARAMKLAPKEWQNNWEKLQAYADAHYKPEKPAYVPKYTNYPGVLRVMQDWVDTYINTTEDIHRPKSLVLWGPSRIGKTEWARSLGYHSYFQGMFNLEEMKEDCDYVVFDDVPGKYFPSYKQWLGGQRDFNCTDKYKKKRLLSGGWPCIACMNEDPMKVETWDKEWLKHNIVSVYIDHKLWEAAPEGANGEFVPRNPDGTEMLYLGDVDPRFASGRNDRAVVGTASSTNGLSPVV